MVGGRVRGVKVSGFLLHARWQQPARISALRGRRHRPHGTSSTPDWGAKDHGRSTASFHCEPLRRPQPARHAGPAGRRPRPAVARARRGGRRALVERHAGAGQAGAWGRWRAPTSMATSTSPAVRSACLASPSRWSAPCRTGATGRRRASRRGCIATRHAPQHRAPLRRLQRVLPDVAGRADGLFVRVLPPRRRLARRGAVAEARPHLPQAAPRCRANGSSTSAAAGARSCSTRPNATASRPRASRCRKTSSTT